MLLRFQLFAISIVGATYSFSQSNTLSTGGNASGTSGTVSYSIGQIDYTNQSNTSGNINQGVQQPYEIYSTNSLVELGDGIFLTVGPNPTNDNLILSNISKNGVKLFCYLLDNNGKELIQTLELIDKVEINLINYPVGMYHLVVRNSEMEIKTFKIIKTQ